MEVLKNDSTAFSSSEQQHFGSEAIDMVRFPLAVMVVFIHSFPDSKWLDFEAISYTSLSAFDAFNVLRRFCSSVFPSIAVPGFFFISGYLFFKKLEQWDWSIWKRKMRSRLKTLVIPYFLWVTLFVLYKSRIYLTIGAIIINGRPISLFSDWFGEYGGFHMYWDSEGWGGGHNWFGGVSPHLTGPQLFPLWFLRDLMVVVALTPLTHWLIKKMGIVPVLLLGIAYITGLWPDLHGLSATAAFFFSAGAYVSIKGFDVSAFYKYRNPFYITCALLLIVNMYFAVGSYTDLRRYFSGCYVLTGVVSALNIAYWFVRYKDIHPKRLLVESCFFIYAFHIFILPDCRKYIEAIVVSDSTHYLIPLTYLVFPCVDIAACILLYYMLRRCLPKTTRILTGGR